MRAFNYPVYKSYSNSQTINSNKTLPDKPQFNFKGHEKTIELAMHIASNNLVKAEKLLKTKEGFIYRDYPLDSSIINKFLSSQDSLKKIIDLAKKI